MSGLQVGDIEQIDVYTHPLAMTLPDPSPVTTLWAKFSLPHMVAATLVYGDGGAIAFSSASLENEEVHRLRHLVRVLDWDGPLMPPHERPARVELNLRGGKRLAAECRSAIGGPDRPLPQEVFIRKVNGLCKNTLPGLSDALLSVQPLSPELLWDEVLRIASQDS